MLYRLPECERVCSGICNDINPDTLEHIFESAWDTLQKLYPDKKFDSCDCFSIYIIEDFIDEDDDFNDDLVFVTGLMDGKPAIQNLGTKEIILVELNSKRWYDYSEESQL